jgi:negative regulator of flagellin synthesis FlgM
MDIRSSLEGLKSLLAAAPPPPAATDPRTTAGAATQAGASALASDRATLSSAGSEVSLSHSEPDVRTDKVAAVQAAIASGNYDVPAGQVASSLIDSMLA